MLKACPLTLKELNTFVERHHRHHKAVRGHRFSFGALNDEDVLVGAISIGRPVARNVDQYNVAEVTRLVTDGSRNVCSFLYSKAARICKEMGFVRVQTYILDEESGISLKAAGWVFDAFTSGGSWNRGQRQGMRKTDQPECIKQRWIREFS